MKGIVHIAEHYIIITLSQTLYNLRSSKTPLPLKIYLMRQLYIYFLLANIPLKMQTPDLNPLIKWLAFIPNLKWIIPSVDILAAGWGQFHLMVKNF